MPAFMMAGSAALGVGGSVFSGIMGKSAAKKQEEALRRAKEEAKGTAQKYVDRAEGWLRPFRDRGDTAGAMIDDLFSGKVSMDDMVQESSMYKFQSELGSRNINRELKARGMYGSGAGLETLARFNNQLVAEEGDRTFSGLMQMNQLGAQVGGQLASGEINTGNNLAGMIMNNGAQVGQARAAGDMAIGGMGQGIAEALGGGLNNMAQYNMFKPFLDKLGGVGSSKPMMSEGQRQEELGRGIVAGTGAPLGADAGRLEGVTWTSNFY